MGYIEIFRMDNDGAGWIDLAQANSDELFNLDTPFAKSDLDILTELYKTLQNKVIHVD